MENSFQTSFIPKKPILTNSPSSANSSNTTSITMVVSVFIFVVIVGAAGGLYVYKNYVLQKNKEALSANLFKIRDSFDKETIAELEMYDKRISVAREVLSGHIVLSPLFEKINELTLKTIQYTKFDHKTTNNTFSVNMSGIAKDYKSIALQADVFNTDKGKMFKDVIFSNLTKDKSNFVTFDVEFNVDPSLLSYGNNVANSTEEVTTNTTNTTSTINTTSTVGNINDAANFPSSTNLNQVLPVTNNPQ